MQHPRSVMVVQLWKSLNPLKSQRLQKTNVFQILLQITQTRRMKLSQQCWRKLKALNSIPVMKICLTANRMMQGKQKNLMQFADSSGEVHASMGFVVMTAIILIPKCAVNSCNTERDSLMDATEESRVSSSIRSCAWIH